MDNSKPTYDILELAAKWQNGTITEQEKLYYENWYASFNDEELESNQDQAGYEAIQGRIYAQLEQRLTADKETNRKTRTLTLWPRVAAVAAAVTAVALCIYFFNTLRHSEGSEATRNLSDYVSRINPGHQGATLTLANGKTIELDSAKNGVIVGNGLIAYSSLRGTKQSSMQDEIASIPRNDVIIMTASTAKGQTYIFTLPDGTKVWLNAASSLTFPSTFAGNGKRNVKLTGEGYFEVAKEKAHPFIVTSNEQQVEVLGTHFNINAYPEEKQIKTTLLEGSVRLSSLRGGAGTEAILKPGEQSLLSIQGAIKVTTVNVDEVMAWQKGYFRFYDEDITTIMRKISRWYDVEVEYSGELPENGFNARITKYASIEEVLGRVEKTNAVHFKIEGRKVIVSK